MNAYSAVAPNIEMDEMPDIAENAGPQQQSTLDWVGMSSIHQPVLIGNGAGEERVLAKVDLYVDITDPQIKGIHMSRLYLQLDEFAARKRLTPASLRELLNGMLDSHSDCSSSASVRFAFDYCVRRPALKSDNSGFNNYPVWLEAVLENGVVTFEVGMEVTYSSTCPCSAALARQLIQRAFDDEFDNGKELVLEDVRAWLGTEQGILATPHSQRSVARIKARLNDDTDDNFAMDELIDAIENVLGTPVQTAVKREDEQEFALRNGQNLMFCEDAARKVKGKMQSMDGIADFWIRIEHQESLHAHDAVAIATRGIKGGYRRSENG